MHIMVSGFYEIIDKYLKNACTSIGSSHVSLVYYMYKVFSLECLFKKCNRGVGQMCVCSVTGRSWVQG